jgi:hypothetical protein
VLHPFRPHPVCTTASADRRHHRRVRLLVELLLLAGQLLNARLRVAADADPLGGDYVFVAIKKNRRITSGLGSVRALARLAGHGLSLDRPTHELACQVVVRSLFDARAFLEPPPQRHDRLVLSFVGSHKPRKLQVAGFVIVRNRRTGVDAAGRCVGLWLVGRRRANKINFVFSALLS